MSTSNKLANKGIDIQVLQEIPHDNYIEKIEKWQMGKPGDNPPTRMNSAYNQHGDYIGDIDTAKVLCDKYGIIPEVIDPDHQVCSIGYSPKHNKYFGWSHRALVGFKIGDKLFEENFGDDNTPFVQHGTQVIKTMEDARTAAARFAKSVATDQLLITASSIAWLNTEL